MVVQPRSFGEWAKVRPVSIEVYVERMFVLQYSSREYAHRLLSFNTYHSLGWRAAAGPRRASRVFSHDFSGDESRQGCADNHQRNSAFDTRRKVLATLCVLCID